jgi:hypothetical protein
MDTDQIQLSVSIRVHLWLILLQQIRIVSPPSIEKVSPVM